MKILVVIGTRPEAIKMAPVMLALRQEKAAITKLCVTGQHREMLDSVLQLFELAPDYDLNVMAPRQNLTDLTSKVLRGMSEVLSEFRPDLVLVHGDTTTTLAASIAAHYAHAKVGHVEAGLRTQDLFSPWPEEMNRRSVDAIASIHFAPTNKARHNLLREGCADVLVTGNTVVDSLLHISGLLDQDTNLELALERQFAFLDKSKRLILVTGHRRESFGAGFENICKALKEIAKRSDVQIVYPVHLNPNVRSRAIPSTPFAIHSNVSKRKTAKAAGACTAR